MSIAMTVLTRLRRSHSIVVKVLKNVTVQWLPALPKSYVTSRLREPYYMLTWLSVAQPCQPR